MKVQGGFRGSLERKTGGKNGRGIRLLLAALLALGLGAAGVLTPAPVAHAGSGWSLPRDLSEVSGSAQAYGPQIALGTDGFPQVVWREFDGVDNQVYYSRNTGNGWIAPVNISSGFANNAQPQIAVDAAGNPHVVWRGDDFGEIILYTTSNDGGWTWGTTTCLNTAATTDNQLPSIALDSNGNPHVVWQAYDGVITERVYYSRYDGSGWTAPVNISPDQGVAYGPLLALDGGDHPHVLWRGTGGIFYAKNTGSAWTLPKDVSDGASLTTNRFHDLALDADGHPHAAWQAFSVGENHICYAADTGGGWTVPTVISTGSEDNWQPRIALSDDGLRHVVWQGSDGSNDLIYHSTSAGAGWTSPVILSPSSTENGDARITLDPDGNPYVVWQGTKESTEWVFFSKNTGTAWTDPFIISSGITDSGLPELALDPDGLPHVVWQGSDGVHNQAWYGRDISELFKAYFAEGCTGEGFQEYLCLGNPANSNQSVKVAYLFNDGTSLERTYAVPALSRFTVNVNAEAGEGRDVSIKCTSAGVFVAERPMYFDYTGGGGSWTGGSDAVGASLPSGVWYFAEGYTGPGFDEWVCVLNPRGSEAHLTFNFQTQEEGLVVPTGTYTVPANSRATFKANDLLEGKSYQTSLKLTSDVPVVAERPMYFDYQGTGGWGWTGGHVVMGTPAPARDYYFAEGYTGPGFEEWLTIQNPGTASISVHAVYQLGSGAPVEKDYPVAATSRATVYVPDEVGAGQNVSVHLSSASVFLAERPVYFDYQGMESWGWTGGHCVIGATGPGTSWFFAEGYTGAGFEEWLCIQNPGSVEARVHITYYPEGGAPIPRSYTVPAASRYTVNVNTDAGPGLAISAGVASDRPVIVERPMYFDFQGKWNGGHDVVGYRP